MTTTRESQHFDRKSIRKVTGSTAGFGEIARDCVCFANGAGGTLLIGIENDADAPPAGQRIEPALLDRIRKRVGELTVNVQVMPELKRHENGGEYIALAIPRAAGVASTSDGRYFLRVGDTCRPIVGDDVMRLASERPGTPWEEMTSQGAPRANADTAKVASFCERLRASDRVKPSVKEKTDDELLAHYDVAKGDMLTNLGVLLVVLLSADAAELAAWETRIAQFLHERLRLRLNDRRKLRPISDGIDFLGYIIRTDYLLVRRRVVGALRERLERAERELLRLGMRFGKCRIPLLTADNRAVPVHRDVFPWPWPLLEQVRQWLGSYLAHLDRASSGRLLESLRRRFSWLDEYFVWTGTRVSFVCPMPRHALRFAEQRSWFLEHMPGHLLIVRQGTDCETIIDGVSTDARGGRTAPAVQTWPRRFPRRRLRSLKRILWNSDLAVAWIDETGLRPGNIAQRAVVRRWGSPRPRSSRD